MSQLIRRGLLACGVALVSSPLHGQAQTQALGDAWWTGPLLANSAGTLPQGHLLFEPYLYDVISPHSHGIGSRTYVEYGLVDRLTVGFIPVFGYNKERDGPSSSGVGLGDVAVLAQYGLTRFREGRWVPTTAIQIQETLPTGRYDRLGDRPSDGFGSGSFTTMVAFNSQSYFWMPTGRVLRVRLDVSEAFSTDVHVEGVSVYGTGPGFSGHVNPGSSTFVDAAWEYSLTQRWVLAFDLTYGHDGNTRVTGLDVLTPYSAQNPSSDAFGFAPAIEYNFSPKVGVILGTRLIPASHNTTATVTPVVAVNIVH